MSDDKRVYQVTQWAGFTFNIIASSEDEARDKMDEIRKDPGEFYLAFKDSETYEDIDKPPRNEDGHLVCGRPVRRGGKQYGSPNPVLRECRNRVKNPFDACYLHEEKSVSRDKEGDNSG